MTMRTFCVRCDRDISNSANCFMTIKTMRTFCDFCDRDISNRGRLRISLDPDDNDDYRVWFLGMLRNVMMREYRHWDACIACARKLDINKLLSEVEREP